MSVPRVVAAGDSTLVVAFDERIDPIVNARAIRCAEAVEAAGIAGVRDIVPTYRTVAVFFDPLHTDYADLVRRLEAAASRGGEAPVASPAPIEVPVCYGGEFGPDLDDVARRANMSPEEVVAAHAGETYRVFMLGFLPGFAYLGLVDPRIATARRPAPRVRVPKGSVGIAGRQTAIYPAESPGGWQLLGRTPIDPFDVGRPMPFLFKAGDAVRFVPVDRPEYERLCRST